MAPDPRARTACACAVCAVLSARATSFFLQLTPHRDGIASASGGQLKKKSCAYLADRVTQAHAYAYETTAPAGLWGVTRATQKGKCVQEFLSVDPLH